LHREQRFEPERPQLIDAILPVRTLRQRHDQGGVVAAWAASNRVIK
jgi:hypothetical protein